ncbi:MAG: outer membrane beta-barrel protein [Bacteroidetes bacterium]|nr:outer membrane beta-barrel protein [Bacteroidota bacterium]
MKKLLLFIAIVLPAFLQAQSELQGVVLDEKTHPLTFATVALIKPSDSTLVYFGITNESGQFDIKSIGKGKYIIQVALIGYQTYSKPLKIPEESGNYGLVVLKLKPLNLSETEIVAEQVPVLMKKDTIEFNAGSFKTKPDAVAEDLLRKLPGVEVDRSGNIKAMGEDVKNVMVDGKEFFSSDPKVATRNLPADAINKVQVYDKKSESAELAGIDDGSREKTINLLLKDGRKQAWLGDISAGGGTGEHYATNAKVYRFTKKDQFAALGMLNNINRFGFSFQDYMDFNGGLPAMMGSGSMKFTITSDNEIPVDFGQTIDGLVTSGAGGLNYSFDFKKNSRFTASYLGNGSQRKLDQRISTKNFLGSGNFEQNENNTETNDNFSHRLNLGWKDKSDSTRTIISNGSLGLTNSGQDALSLIKTLSEGDLVSELKSQSRLNRQQISANGTFSYLQRGKGPFKLLEMGVNAAIQKGLGTIDRNNILHQTGNMDPMEDKQFRNNTTDGRNLGISFGSVVKIGNGLYLDPRVNTTTSYDQINRVQGIYGDAKIPVDSLSPTFSRNSLRITPGLTLRKNFRKTKISLGLYSTNASTSNSLKDSSSYYSGYRRLLPVFSWEYEYKMGHRLSLEYGSSVDEPQLELMLPVMDNSNPLSLLYGNRILKPETRHELFFNWLLFDQFSQTSVFARVGGTYTADKVGYSRNIDEQLIQVVQLENTKGESQANGNFEFSTPVKLMKFNAHLSLDGTWKQGLTRVNGIENTTNSFTRSIGLSFDNPRTDKWNLNFGGEFSMTNASYSFQESMNNRYLTLTYFADLSINPTDSWHFGTKADVVNYSSGSFSGTIQIPLISAEASYSFLKNHRGMLILESYDLLDKNKGINRISEMNYQREIHSNIIGRYLLFSFKYRLNKAAKTGGLEINMKKH